MLSNVSGATGQASHTYVLEKQNQRHLFGNTNTNTSIENHWRTMLCVALVRKCEVKVYFLKCVMFVITFCDCD